ncbi:MAG TPA: anti-sigma factor antagonist [Cyanobacteria bacterium UBA8530]|nr:anti-sigma factor antagonist [Cyanobacteria bacterium UBA8530]
MQTSAHQQNASVVMAVTGRLDAVTTTEFDQDCAQYSSEKLILDLSGLEYVSSAGLRGILSVAKKMKAAGGSLSLCGLSGLVLEVFTVSGFDNFLPIFEDIEKACAGNA